MPRTIPKKGDTARTQHALTSARPEHSNPGQKFYDLIQHSARQEGISMAKMARRAKVEPRHISRFAEGKSGPTLATLLEFRRAGVPIGQLFLDPRVSSEQRVALEDLCKALRAERDNESWRRHARYQQLTRAAESCDALINSLPFPPPWITAAASPPTLPRGAGWTVERLRTEQAIAVSGAHLAVRAHVSGECTRSLARMIYQELRMHAGPNSGIEQILARVDDEGFSVIDLFWSVVGELWAIPIQLVAEEGRKPTLAILLEYRDYVWALGIVLCNWMLCDREDRAG